MGGERGHLDHAVLEAGVDAELLILNLQHERRLHPPAATAATSVSAIAQRSRVLGVGWVGWVLLGDIAVSQAVEFHQRLDAGVADG